VASRLTALGRRRVFRRGSVLLVQEQHPSTLFLLLAGRVKVSFDADDGREVLLDILGPGTLIGVLVVLDGNPAVATVTAVDEVEVYVIGAGAFRMHLSSDPEMAELLLKVMAGRLRRTAEDRAALALNDSLGRVALRLIQLAARYGERENGRVKIAMPISQGELAAWTGLSREATNKALHLLRQKGVIHTNRREISILSAEGLLRRITGPYACPPPRSAAVLNDAAS
jgi:CRP-like cAMP-binding protein